LRIGRAGQPVDVELKGTLYYKFVLQQGAGRLRAFAAAQ
jgi:hypothetical protein